MSHSHMPIRHLLKQVEIFKSKRAQRDVRPQWVTQFIDEVADLFEPMTDVGRVGFDCRLAEECWFVSLFLGSTEVVGGPEDGQSHYTNFRFDLSPLLERFSRIERFAWNSLPHQSESDDHGSYITIEGHLEENRLRLDIRSIPPETAGPGFKVYPNGRYDIA